MTLHRLSRLTLGRNSNGWSTGYRSLSSSNPTVFGSRPPSRCSQRALRIGKGVFFPRNHTNFTQGDPADAVFYLQTGKVRLTVVSKTGNEATIGILSDGSFFGKGSLAGQALRMDSATAMTDCAVLRIQKKAMMQALHWEHAFSDLFVAYLLARNIRYEEDLVDQLFNSSEKGLARVLLMLAHFGKEAVPETVVHKISQETLAKMVGTTRLRVSFLHEPVQEIGIHPLQR